MVDHIEFTPTSADMAAALAAMRPAGAIGWLAWPSRLNEGDPRLDPRSIAIRNEGLEISQAGMRSEVDWTAIARIEERPGTLLFVTQWKDAYFVPMRVFASPAEAADFLGRARQLWQACWNAAAAGTTSYQLTYRLNRGDVAAFLGLGREITGWRKFFFFAPPAIFGGVYGWFRDTTLLADFMDWLGNWAILLVLVLVGLWYLVFALAARLWQGLRARRTVLPAGETTLAADENGVSIAADGKQARYGWRDIPAVTLGAAHVFLSTDPERAVIVPLRAFRNRVTMIGFYNFAEEASKHAQA